MEQWQDAASQQVRLLTNRLNELLSKGLGWLRSELGMDLGLKPDLIPPWVILLAACSGLVLMVALWASLCRSVFKKRPSVSSVDDGTEVKRGVSKPVKSEEPKKKRRKTDKKAQSNGRAIAEPQEEAIVSEEIVPHQQPPPSEVKPEKAGEGKKSKKKVKQAVKENKTLTADGKEPEDGMWETKVSNKEKREQRKKDKSSSDGSASPGGADTPVSTPSEQPKVPAASSQKKKKGESTKAKQEKVEPVVPQESWTMIETGMTTSLSGLSTGGGSVDPSSDWNAPSEAWGNYEEPTPVAPPAQEKPTPEMKVNLIDGADDDDDEEKDKGETSADGGSKTKKKKKKKKKVAEEAAGQGEEPQKDATPATSMKKPFPVQEVSAAIQPVKAASVETRVTQPVKDNISQKTPVTQVPQKPTDEESQAPKPAKKKKARRET
ncbi:protein LYRIC isoform X5 [Antennarius striatus]|uniref:protein LYRIC isoform X5 n=1 Tax=Antennarius striatus TaxID=241820 RepID=UPI0035B2742C